MQLPDLSQIWPEWQISEDVKQPIGVGQFGAVYKAVRRDNMVESYSAIKIISVPKDPSDIGSLNAQGLKTDQDINKYLQNIVNDCVNEIQLMESLKGIQNIVSVEDYKIVKKNGQYGWDIYIRMELLTPLTKYIERQQLDEEDVIRLGCDICSALEACGKKGIIHRDIKPENIFVNDFGYFKLGDFGIARSLGGKIGNLSIKGTPPYMAPEVANSKDYDARVDTYSLGIVLYLYLNKNRLPFLVTKEQAHNPEEVRIAINRRLQGEKIAPPSQASDKLAEVVLKACAYNPKARFQNATQMKQALQNAQRRSTRTGSPLRTFFTILLTLLLMGGAAAGLLFSGIITIPSLNINVNQPAVTENPEIDRILDQAEDRVSNGDIEGAIQILDAGLNSYPDSDKLDDARDTYSATLRERRKTAALEKAQELADQNDFAGAIAVLQEAISTQGPLTEFVDARTLYQDKYNELELETAKNDAQQLAARGDYLAAILMVDNITYTMGESEDLIAWRAELEVSYVNEVLQSAETALLTKNYDAADQQLSEALEYFPENEALIALYAKVQHSRPVYLLDEVIPYKTVGRYTPRSSITMGGKTYQNGFTVMGYGAFNEGNQVLFNLDGDYSMISFTAGIVSDKNNTVTFLFHADGELVYKFSMKSKETPSSHVFNIVGCKQFVISVYDTNDSDRSGTFALTDIMVTRNVSSLNKDQTQPKENQVYLMNETQPYIVPSRYEGSAVLSMGGKNYANGFSCMGYGAYNEGNLTYFNLDKNYSKITFTTGIVLDRGKNVVYRFYTDGTLAYEVKLGESDLATTHSFSVEGCRQLIVSVCDGSTTPDVSGTYGIADIIMDKSKTYKAPTEEKTYSLKSGESFLLDTIAPHLVPTRYNSGEMMSMGGKNYSHGFSCMGYGAWGKGNQVAFKLDGKYKTISLTGGIILDRGRKVTFKFMADGKQIYEFSLGEGDLPTDHTFSVEGVSELVICVIDGQQGADSSGTYGLANIVIAK